MPDVPKVVLDRLRAQATQATHPDADVLTAFAEQALSGAERERVLAHLAACGDCRDVVAFSLPAQEAAAASVPEPATTLPSRAKADRRPWFAWPNLRWAALAAAAVVVTSALWLRPNKAPQESMVARVNQEAEAPSQPSVSAPLPPSSTTATVAESKEQARTRGPQAEPPAPALAKEFKADALQPRTTTDLRLQESAEATGKKQAPVAGLTVGALVADKPATLRDQKNNIEGRRTDALGTEKLAQVPAAPQTAPQESDVAKGLSRTETAEVIGGPVTAAQAPVAGQSKLEGRTAGSIQKAKSAAKDDDTQRQFANMKLEARGASSNYAASYDESLAAQATWRVSEGSLQRSLDAGADWQTVLKPDRALLCQAPLGKEIWAGGRGGLLLHSGDAGRTWTVVHPATQTQALTDDITAIAVTKPGAVSVTTAVGEVWSTADNGATWVKK